MIIHPETQASGKPVDGALKVAVVERHETPTAITEQMMVMNARWIDQLIASHRVPQLQPCDQTAVIQEVQNAIDARASYSTLARA